MGSSSIHPSTARRAARSLHTGWLRGAELGTCHKQDLTIPAGIPISGSQAWISVPTHKTNLRDELFVSPHQLHLGVVFTTPRRSQGTTKPLWVHNLFPASKAWQWWKYRTELGKKLSDLLKCFSLQTWPWGPQWSRFSPNQAQTTIGWWERCIVLQLGFCILLKQNSEV